MLRDLDERRVLRQVELDQHLLVGDARLAVGEVRALEAEGDAVRRQRLGLLQPGQGRFRVDEAPDQPRAGEPIGPQRLARHPGAAEQRLAGRERGLRLRGKKQLAHLGVGLGERRLGAAARLAREEVERGDALELAPLLVHHARDRARVGVAEAHAQALDGLDQVLVARRAVEEAHERQVLRRRNRAHLHHVRAAVDLGDVVGERFERLAVGRGIGQQIDAFAHDRGAERLQRAQHAHARRRILHRQLRDRQQPARRREALRRGNVRPGRVRIVGAVRFSHAA